MSRHRPRGVETRKATSAPDISSLGTTVRRGAAVSAITLGIVQVVSFAQTLVLARLLSPEQIGLFAAGTVLSGFLVGISEGGLRGALVQRRDDVENAADTVFWATAATGVLLAIGSLLISPLVGDLFQNDTAGVIAAVTSGTLVMHALTNVPDGLMQRRFNFKRRLIVEPSRVLSYAVVSIGLAASGFGVWALVIANYVGLAVWLVGTWWLARWRPGIGRPSYRLWREMARFAYPLLIEGLVGRVRTAAETTLVGRTLQADTLGQYRYGQRLSLLPALAIVQIGSYVLFPAFSRLAEDPERFRRAFMRASQSIWVASVPVAGLTLAIGEPAVVVLLGEQWRGAGLAVMAMAGYGLGTALQAAGSEVIKASGRSQLLNWTTGTSMVLGIGLLVALLPLGLLGVGLAISITEMAIGVVVLILVRRVIPFSVGRMAWMLVPPTVAAGVAMVAVYALDRMVLRADSHGTFTGVLLIAVEALAYLLVYLVVLGAIAPRMARSVITGIGARLAKRRGAAATDDRGGVDDRFDDHPTTVLRLVVDVDDTVRMAAVAVPRRQVRPAGTPRAVHRPVGPPRQPGPPPPPTDRPGSRRAPPPSARGQAPPAGGPWPRGRNGSGPPGTGAPAPGRGALPRPAPNGGGPPPRPPVAGASPPVPRGPAPQQAPGRGDAQPAPGRGAPPAPGRGAPPGPQARRSDPGYPAPVRRSPSWRPSPRPRADPVADAGEPTGQPTARTPSGPSQERTRGPVGRPHAEPAGSERDRS